MSYKIFTTWWAIMLLAITLAIGTEAPSDVGLVAYWSFDGSLSDIAGETEDNLTARGDGGIAAMARFVTPAQLSGVSGQAVALGRYKEYAVFNDRGQWWKNVMYDRTGYAQMKDSSGAWKSPFDPITREGEYRHEYTEGSAWQLSFFVPQDVPALIRTVGKDLFIKRLEQGFEVSEPFRYFPPGGQWVFHGNQQSMHFAFLFNWAGRPWLTQKWARSIMSRYYGRGVSNAYLGQEDQGQMSAWYVMSAIGLFQTDGGCRAEPIYEIASPLFEKVVIDLGQRYGRGHTFTIEARNASRKNKYVQRAKLNGKELNTFYFPASELLKGGSLVLEMGDAP